VTISDQGNVIINTSGAVAGSGIRQIDTTGKDDAFEAALKRAQPARSVDLVAPIGEINAGDAGIGASGNINIAAARVIGADNIDIGGVAVGVPVADTSGFTGGFSGADGAAAAVNKASEDAAESTSDSPVADEALAWLEVTFAGFGEEQSGQ
ncbi:MAG TPA: filamentous hemagglutinin family protein, partial [Pseudomonadales bacterium]|nr:filamentous hemagglutinin family protein [Pseudomonadales bacterium]